jgi:hypothetical protein
MWPERADGRRRGLAMKTLNNWSTGIRGIIKIQRKKMIRRDYSDKTNLNKK